MENKWSLVHWYKFIIWHSPSMLLSMPLSYSIFFFNLKLSLREEENKKEKKQHWDKNSERKRKGNKTKGCNGTFPTWTIEKWVLPLAIWQNKFLIFKRVLKILCYRQQHQDPDPSTTLWVGYYYQLFEWVLSFVGGKKKGLEVKILRNSHWIRQLV